MSPRCATAKSRLVGSPTMAASIAPAALDGALHGRVLGLLAVAQDHQQPPALRPAGVGHVLRGREHRRHRGLGVARAAAVEPVALDRRA